MHKNQKLQQSFEHKESSTKTLETAALKLETLTIKLEVPKVDNNKISVGNSSQDTEIVRYSTKQASKVLKISETNVNQKPISKNNVKTPILRKITSDKSAKASKSNKARKGNHSTYKKKEASKVTTNYEVPKKPEPIQPKITNVSKNTQTQEETKKKPAPEVLKTVRPNPKSVCTCESLKPKEPVPLTIPIRQEPKNIPKYRWVAVKSDALKTDIEKTAEIRALKTETTSQTSTNIRKKPRLCPFCWSNVLKTRREEEEKRRREWMVAKTTDKKPISKSKNSIPKGNSTARNNNQFGFLLDEESA